MRLTTQLTIRPEWRTGSQPMVRHSPWIVNWWVHIVNSRFGQQYDRWLIFLLKWYLHFQFITFNWKWFYFFRVPSQLTIRLVFLGYTEIAVASQVQRKSFLNLVHGNTIFPVLLIRSPYTYSVFVTPKILVYHISRSNFYFSVLALCILAVDISHCNKFCI